MKFFIYIKFIEGGHYLYSFFKRINQGVKILHNPVLARYPLALKAPRVCASKNLGKKSYPI